MPQLAQPSRSGSVRFLALPARSWGRSRRAAKGRGFAVGTSIAGRPPHRSGRARIRASGSYLGGVTAKRRSGACRTRSSAWVTRARLWVRCVLCWSAFPLVPALGSTASAAGVPALFDGFTATMAESTSPDRASSATAPRLPAADHLAQAAYGRPRDLPVPVQGACAHARFYDHAGSSKCLRWRAWTCCLPLHRQRRHPELVFYRGSMAGLHVPLPTLRRHPHGCLRTARGRCGSLLLHRRWTCTTYSLPVSRRTCVKTRRKFAKDRAEQNFAQFFNSERFKASQKRTKQVSAENAQKFLHSLGRFEPLPASTGMAAICAIATSPEHARTAAHEVDSGPKEKPRRSRRGPGQVGRRRPNSAGPLAQAT